MKIRIIVFILSLSLLLPLMVSCTDKGIFPFGTEDTDVPVDTVENRDPEPGKDYKDTDDTGAPAPTDSNYHRIGKSEDGRLDMWDDSLSPVKVVYEFMGYIGEIYETEDPELIARLVEALKNVEVGEDGAESGCDNGDVIFFTMDDGSEYSVWFNFGNLEVYSSGNDAVSYYRVYETTGFGQVKSVLNEIKEAGMAD